MAKQTFTTGQVLTAAQLTSLQQTAMSGGAASAKTASYTLVAADAGTAISMTSTSATTITVNTGLFAAGDTVFIQNLGTGNLTITAGTATVNTAGSLILPQYDAGLLYFVSASSAVFYDYIQVGATSPLTTKGDLYTFSTSNARLPVGANGTTLVADSAEATGLKWATPSSGALTLIDSSTFTTSAAISRNNVFSSTYQNYMVVVEGLCASDAELRMRLRASGTDDTGNNYVYGLVFRSSTAIGSGYDGAGNTWEIGYFGTNTSVASVIINDPFNSVRASYVTQSGAITTSRPFFAAGGGHNLTTSYDGFTLSAGGNNLTGTVRTYGLAN